jgi:hypothetical protein
MLEHNAVPPDALHLLVMIDSSHAKKQRPQYHGNPAALLSLLCVLIPAAGVGEPVNRGTVPATGLHYWEWRGQGALFRLTQRLPDQTRAFFLARGFASKDADFLARNCVFQTLFENTDPAGGATLDYDLDEWKVHAQGTTQGLLTRERWSDIWEARGVSQAARIAFEWSLLPTRQRYQPADYNWGMTSFGLEPGSRFDLDFSYERAGTRHNGRFEGVECPADVHPEPQDDSK